MQKKLNFYKSLASYIIVISFLWVIWLMSGAGFAWPVFVMLGWGVGLAFQAIDAFALGVSDSQRQQMIEEEMRRMNQGRY